MRIDFWLRSGGPLDTPGDERWTMNDEKKE
jgi:hypothetical protein